MTTTIAINCGCGFRVASNDVKYEGKINNAAVEHTMVAANQHCAETGHTMEILGTVQP